MAYVKQEVVNLETKIGAELLNPMQDAIIQNGQDIEELKQNGSGLPTGGAAHQMLVTDADGVAKWEDKLCYGEVAEVEILPQTDLLAAGDGQFACMTPVARIPAVGDSLTVTYNNGSYSCTVMSIAGETGNAIAFGNLSMMGGAMTNDPFGFIVVTPELAEEAGGASLIGFALDGAETVTLSIRGVVSNVKQIDEKYIPGRFFGNRPYRDRVFLSERTVDMMGSQGYFNFDYPLQEGQVYTVGYNGQLYTCTSRYVANSNVIGIGQWNGEGDDVPFFVAYAYSAMLTDSGYVNGYLYTEDGSATVTISVVGSGVETVRIPEAYIEENATPFVFTVEYSISPSNGYVVARYTADYDALDRAWNTGRAMFCLLKPHEEENTRMSYMLSLAKRINNGGTYIFATPRLYGEQFILRYEYGGGIEIEMVTNT